MKETFKAANITKYWKNQLPPDIQQLQGSNKKFTDPFFLPNDYSLTSRDKAGNFTDPKQGSILFKEFTTDHPNWKSKIEWRRPSSNQVLFTNNEINVSNVFQGEISNSYFISAIKSLSSMQSVIQDKFRTTTYNAIGYYEIVLFIDGQWQIVIVDDNIPYNKQKNNYAFAYSKDNSIWVMLLEKAWAKINGGYTNTIHGNCVDPLTALTSYASTTTELTDMDEHDLVKLYNRIQTAFTNKNIITFTSGESKFNMIYKLTAQHSFALKDMKYCKDTNVYLLKIADSKEVSTYCGEWSPSSKRWTDEMKKKFNYSIQQDKSEFYIDINSFKKVIQQFNICYPMNNAYAKAFTFQKEKFFVEPLVFNIALLSPGDTSISVFFRNKRFNRSLHDINHPTSLVLFKYDNNKQIEQVKGSWKCEDDLRLCERLDTGNYIMWVYCAYDYVSKSEQTNFEFTVEVKSTSEFKEEFLGIDGNYGIVHNLFVNYFNNTKRSKIGDEFSTFSGSIKDSLNCGLFCRILANLNKGNKQQNSLNVRTNVFKHKSFFTFPPNNNNEELTVSFDIPPMESVAMISMRIETLTEPVQYGPFATNWSNTSAIQLDATEAQQVNDFIKNTIMNTTKLMKNEINNHKYNTPAIDVIEYDNEENTLMKQTINTMKTQMNIIKEKKAYEMDILLKNFSELNNKDIKLIWREVQGDKWKYWGEVNESNNELHGRGIMELKSKVYIGYFLNGDMCYGMWISLKNKNVIYKGGFTKGKKNGFGKDLFDNGNYWQGNYINGKKEGVGIFVDVKGGFGIRSDFHNGQELNAVKVSGEELKGILQGNLQKDCLEFVVQQQKENVEKEKEKEERERKKKEEEERERIKQQEEEKKKKENEERERERKKKEEEEQERKRRDEEERMKKKQQEERERQKKLQEEERKKKEEIEREKKKKEDEEKMRKKQQDEEREKKKKEEDNQKTKQKEIKESTIKKNNEDSKTNKTIKPKDEKQNQNTNQKLTSSKISNTDKSKTTIQKIPPATKEKTLTKPTQNQPLKIPSKESPSTTTTINQQPTSKPTNTTKPATINKNTKTNPQQTKAPSQDPLPKPQNLPKNATTQKPIPPQQTKPPSKENLPKPQPTQVNTSNNVNPTSPPSNYINEDSRIITTTTIKPKEKTLQEQDDPNTKSQEFISNLLYNLLKEKFMTSQILILPPLEKVENLQLIRSKNDNTIEYVGGIQNGQKTGRGVLYKDNKFYIGYFKNDIPNGLFFVFDKNKILLFKGNLSSYELPKWNGTYYNVNQNIPQTRTYIQNKLKCSCILQEKDEVICCGAENGLLQGKGIAFSKNGLFKKSVLFNKDKKQTEGPINRNDDKSNIAPAIIDYINMHCPGMLEKLIKLPYLKLDTTDKFIWNKITLPNGVIYVGECLEGKTPFGRGCFIYTAPEFVHIEEKLYMGYAVNGKRHGKGELYSKNKTLIFEGNFEDDMKQGYGIAYRNDGTIYYGNFHKGKLNGLGVLYKDKNSRIEGFFTDNYIPLFSYLVSTDKCTIQSLSYNNSSNKYNAEGMPIDCKGQEYLAENKEALDAVTKEFPEQTKLFKALKPTADVAVLRVGQNYSMEGLYIGEVNQIGFKHGRGVLIDSRSKEYYVGYFINDVKEGEGTVYKGDGKMFYKGMFVKNEKNGKGKFFLENKSTLEGVFNNIGEGKGVLIKENGEKWEGNFYGYEQIIK